MNPLVVLTAVFAAACAAPADYAAAPVAVAAHAPVAYAAAPVAAHVPAPYTTAQQGAPTTTIHQAPATVTKQVHLGSTTYVAGHKTEIIKPPTPVLPIAVPTALKGTVSHNAPIVKTVKETHVVNEPYPVEKRVHVPYDVPVYKENIIKNPVPVHVQRPYAVPVPTPVRGEDIVQVQRTAPIVKHHHTNVVAQPVIAKQAIVAQPAVAAVGYAQPAIAATGYAAAPAIATAGYAAAPAIAAHY